MMEHLPASDADAVQESLRMVDEADIYVGILAHRYGYVPKGADRSITQMEYERAVERGISRLMFLMHKDTPVLAEDVETGPDAEKLKAFKERVGVDRVVHFFRSEDDLRAGLIQALGKLVAEDTGSMAEADAGGSDLNVSSLSGSRRLSALAGHPVLSPAAYAAPVYTGGVEVSFTLAHNGVGKHSINLHALILEVARYESDAKPELAYQIEGEEVQGAGVARPHLFQVTLAGRCVEPARWIVDPVRGTVLRALSRNFLHTPDPRILTFPAGSADIEEIQGSVLAAQAGLYELRFAFHYSVAGVDREQRFAAFLVYSNE